MVTNGSYAIYQIPSCSRIRPEARDVLINAIVKAEARNRFARFVEVDVETVDDLDNRIVGVLAGGASEIYARNVGLSARPYPTIAEAAEARDAQAHGAEAAGAGAR